MALKYPSRDLATRLGTTSLFTHTTSFWETKANRTITPCLNRVCFGQLDWTNTQSVRFIAAAAPGSSITVEILRFWIRFMRHVLTDMPWSARIVEIPMAGASKVPAIYARLHRMAINRKTSLVYLSLIRYPKQWPSVVKALYDARADVSGPDELFQLMQEMHKGEGKHTAFRYVSDSHTPIMNRRPCPWGTDWVETHLSSVVPVTISQFSAACRSGKALTATAHFRSDLLPEGGPDQPIALMPLLPMKASKMGLIQTHTIGQLSVAPVAAVHHVVAQNTAPVAGTPVLATT